MDDYTEDFGEFNEVVEDVEEEIFADTQLSLAGSILMTTLTTRQLKDLVDEFVSFQINEMTQEDMYQYLRDIMRHEIICQRNHLTLQESLKEKLMSMMSICMTFYYVQDREGAYTRVHTRQTRKRLD